jgi:hypothetical protein
MDSLDLLKGVKLRIEKCSPPSPKNADSFNNDSKEMIVWIDELIQTKEANRLVQPKMFFTSDDLADNSNMIRDGFIETIRIYSRTSVTSDQIDSGDLLVQNGKILSEILGASEVGTNEWVFSCGTPMRSEIFFNEKKSTYYIYGPNYEESK